VLLDDFSSIKMALTARGTKLQARPRQMFAPPAPTTRRPASPYVISRLNQNLNPKRIYIACAQSMPVEIA
jgi:hypothetical protein